MVEDARHHLYRVVVPIWQIDFAAVETAGNVGGIAAGFHELIDHVLQKGTLPAGKDAISDPGIDNVLDFLISHENNGAAAPGKDWLVCDTDARAPGLLAPER
jgi:hypothetical protein